METIEPNKDDSAVTIKDLSKVISDVIEEILTKLLRLRQELCELKTIDLIVAQESTTRTLIDIKKLLDKYPESGKMRYSPTITEEDELNEEKNNEINSKINNFKKSVDYTIWECNSKLSMMNEFSSTLTDSGNNVKKALALAQLLHKIKQLLQSKPTSSLTEQTKKTPDASTALLTGTLSKNTTNKNALSEEEEMIRTIDGVISEFDITFQSLSSKFEVEFKLKQNRFEDILVTVRTLKELRQLLIQYDEKNYDYPTEADIKKSTQRVRDVHKLGQGKVVMTKELGKDTLNEIRLNVTKCRKTILDKSKLSDILRYAYLLKTMKQRLDKIKPTPTTKIRSCSYLSERLAKLQELLSQEPKFENDLEAKQFAELYDKLSNYAVMSQLLRINVQQLQQYVKSSGNSEFSENYLINDDISRFLEESSRNNIHVLGNRKEHLEKLISLLRSEPRYLTVLAKFVPFQRLDDLTDIITNSIASDLYLSGEEIIFLRLIKSFIDGLEPEKFKIAHEVLRGNTVLTKLINRYTTRASGHFYLQYVLSEPLNQLTSKDDLVELDPVKVYMNLFPSEPIPDLETAKLNVEVLRVLEISRNKLTEFCERFFEKIIKSLPEMPFGMRWVAKQLANHASVIFHSDEREVRILLGSFIFLRFFTPAITTPQNYGLIAPTRLTNNHRRTLLLIAQVLQCLAIGTNFNKSPWMEPMATSFLSSSRTAINSYFSKLIDVHDDLPQFMGCADQLKTTNWQRSVVISHKAVSDLLNLLREHESKLITSESDPLVKLLHELHELQLDDKPKSNYSKLFLLRISQETAPKKVVSRLETAKFKMIQFLLKTKTSFAGEKKANELLLETLYRIRTDSSDKEEIKELVFELIVELAFIAESYKELNYTNFLEEIELDHWKRVQMYEYALIEKIELMQAIEMHRRDTSNLTESKLLYYDYLKDRARIKLLSGTNNTTTPSFDEWLRTRELKTSIYIGLPNTDDNF